MGVGIAGCRARASEGGGAAAGEAFSMSCHGVHPADRSHRGPRRAGRGERRFLARKGSRR
jgi:hypothetical protein